MSNLNLSQATILIIDDNATHLRMLLDYLEANGYLVLIAREGRDGYVKADHVIPDLILLDIMLPDISGFETCQRLMANERTRDIPVIFMTSLMNMEDKVKAFDAGGVDYITKPFEVREVLARITIHIRLRALTREVNEANAKLAQQVSREQQKVRDLTERNTIIGQAIEASNDMVLISDMQSQVIYVNPAFNKRLGHDVMWVNSNDGLAALFADSVASRQLLSTVMQGDPWTAEATLQSASGNEVTALVRATPIFNEQDQQIGWICLMTDISDRKRTEREKDVLLTSVERHRQQLRQLSARLAETQEVERKRLARELHDRVGQNLSTLGVMMNIVRSQLTKHSNSALTPLITRLDDAVDLLSETAHHTHDVMADLRPPMLDDYGLIPTLKWYGGLLEARSGLIVTVRGGEAPPRLDRSVENTLFRIVQEALTNVVKHAQASEAIVTFKVNPEQASLVVADNGIGFDTTRLNQNSDEWRWGLLTMTERVETVGGHCTVKSMPGQGTQVVVEIAR